MPEFNDRRAGYGMEHSPSETGPALHEIGERYPDIYDHPEYYASIGEKHTQESARAIRGSRDKGPDHPVTLYRSAPLGVETFNRGDWVSLSPTYAREAGYHNTDEDQDRPTYKATVPAKHVRWAEDDLNEFGYFGPDVKAVTHRRGGRNAPKVGE